jgi:octaprenyl-diphosphate synthase
LIAACTAIGATSVDASEEDVKKMHTFGELIGIAFQIKDDLFDYSENKIGKPTGIDIKEKKMTLPLIYALNHCSKEEKKWLINSVKNYNTDKKRVKEVIEFVKKNQGIEYTIQKMKVYQQKALAILEEYPDSPYRASLISMVNYVIEREI